MKKPNKCYTCYVTCYIVTTPHCVMFCCTNVAFYMFCNPCSCGDWVWVATFGFAIKGPVELTNVK